MCIRDSIFTATLPTDGAVSFTAEDTVTANVAIGLNAAILASTSYAGQAFTSDVSGLVVTLTAKVAGTGFTQTSGTTNLAAVAQINTITIGGTVEVGDIFTATLPTDGAVSFTAEDTVTANVAIGLNAAILASTSYAGQAFTSDVSGSVVTLTAKVAGTGFTQTSGTTNLAAVAQINTITIGGTVEVGDIFTATLPTDGAVSFTAEDTVTANVAIGLNAAILASTSYAGQAFTSDVSGSVVTLTAKVAGTGFTQTSGTTNLAAVAQINTITIGGTVEVGDIFTATLPTDGAVSFTAEDTVTANVAIGLNAAILASTSYAGQAFTSDVSGSV